MLSLSPHTAKNLTVSGIIVPSFSPLPVSIPFAMLKLSERQWPLWQAFGCL